VSVLIVGETEDYAADRIVLELASRGHEFVRFNHDRIATSTISWSHEGPAFAVTVDNKRLDSDSISGVWYRRTPSLPKSDWIREFSHRQWDASIVGAVQSLGIGAMNPPAATWLAENKLVQLASAQQVGLRTPRTVISNDPMAVYDFIGSTATIGKAVVSGGGTDDSGRFVLPTVEITSLVDPDSITPSPTIYQGRISARRHHRITYVDGQMWAVSIRCEGSVVDWRMIDDSDLKYDLSWPPPSTRAALTKLMGTLGLVYGAVDMIEDDEDEWIFLEVNPGGQWSWLEYHVDVPITRAIVDRLVQ
jgi:hypothetical protein